MVTVNNILNARYTLPVWLWVFVSTATGIFTLYFKISDPEEFDYLDGLFPFDGWVWATVMVVGGISALIGMGMHRVWPLRIGAMGSFFAWLYASFTFLDSPQPLTAVVLLSAPMSIFWAYKYMVSYLRGPYDKV